MPLWYCKETSFRARFLHFVSAIHFHSNRGGGTGLGEINELINRGEWGWWKADCYPVSLSGHQVIVDLRHCWLSTFFPNAIRTRNTNQRGYCSLNDLWVKISIWMHEALRYESPVVFSAHSTHTRFHSHAREEFFKRGDLKFDRNFTLNWRF